MNIMAMDIPATAARMQQRQLSCKEAAKLQFPTERKSRRTYKQECKQAWKTRRNRNQQNKTEIAKKGTRFGSLLSGP